ncbi:MAG: ribonuclease Y [Candidatus Omnitrophica bacterium]|jgi:ribonuclease Y|nr:ribonuclease Y [Candidatus Omnitrophota bacterium]MDD3275363.1 ribonuclease Y [Candidatus Omnitrophota bacterium]MDD5077895.1 ribonuclease Y [Candidatus Omnitrophota bacterium]
MILNIVVPLFVALVAAYCGYFLRKYIAEKRVKSAELQAEHILQAAKKDILDKRREAELEAKDLLYRMRQDFEGETKERKLEIANQEKRLTQKEENIDRRIDLVEKKEKEIETRNDNLKKQEEGLRSKDSQLHALISEEKERLQKISSLSAEEAKQILLGRLNEELNSEKAVFIRRQEEEVRSIADKKAREILSLAIQRCAAEHTVETTVSVVNLPNDEMKGRIIGREGRNIRALEMATGVDVIIDDTPGAVTLSGFDAVRREIARLSLEKLISDGRIHPGRIEEIVEKTKKEMDEKIREEGERAAFEAGVNGLHPEIIKLLGRLKYRTSYGQNALQHSKEVSFILGIMSSELGLDFKTGRRIGLLHDIGKAVDHQVEGTHAKLGADLAKKYNESAEVIESIESHHEESPVKSIYGVLAIAADAVSAARPGARRETLEVYVKRLDKLESIANLFKGVEKSFAIQAGREIRVIVQPEKINDNEAVTMCREIRKKIEEGMEYPGQIKVTVIRETRTIEYAK